MAGENQFVLYAMFMGIFITFIYDILRIFRRVFPHKGFLVSLEDIIFWIYCSAKVFMLMYHESNGTLRWFAVFGAIAGMMLYMKLVSPFFVKYVSLLLKKIVGIIKKAVAFILHPFIKIFSAIWRRIMRAARRHAIKVRKKKELGRKIGYGLIKKKLTFLRKLLRINL